MKKRVLSLLMALAMCLSMLPATALAEELGTGAAETQTEQQVPEKPKQEEQPVEDQKQEEESDDPVQAAQALINALPEEVTAENAEEIEQQLMALDAALEKLTEEQYALLDMTRYAALCEALTNLTAEQEGQADAHTGEHGIALPEGESWQGVSTLTDDMAAGYYYLTEPVELTDGTWSPADGVVLDLNGHSITANDAFDAITVGAGVHFTLTDCKGGGENYGSITHYKVPNNNTKERVKGRGVKVSAGGSFTMYGGCIGPNLTKNDAGAGVYVESGATFAMHGGEIAGNTVSAAAADNGGGIWTAGTVTIGGDAKITGNMAQAGGGVYVAGGTLTLRDNAVVTDNTANNAYGSGIFVGAAGKLQVSGSVQVMENKYNTITCNVYLDGTTTITPIAVVDALTSSASIGVSLPSAVLGTITDDNSIILATANGEGWITENSFVNENGDTRTMYVADDNKTVLLGTHAHEWVYTASSDGTITAKCKNENCTSNGGSVTIQAPDAGTLTYDGSAKPAKLEGEFKSGVTTTITYQVKEGKDFVALPAGETVPTNAGYYKASITVGEGANKATASVEYSIERATLTAEDFIVTLPTNLIYDGNEKLAAVRVKDGIVAGTVEWKYWYPQDEQGRWSWADTPKDVGTYVVRINVPMSDNYYAVQGLTDPSWIFTVTATNKWSVNIPENWKNQTVIEGSTYGSVLNTITNYGRVTATGVNNETLYGTFNWYTDEACKNQVDYNAKFAGKAGTTATLYWKFTLTDEYQKKNYTTDTKTGSVDFTIVEGKPQELSFKDAGGAPVTAGTKNYGNWPFTLLVKNSTDPPKEVPITYTSSDKNVATIAVNAYGEITVTICGVGTTQITATAAMVPGQYAQTTATYTLTVEKGEWNEAVSVAMLSYSYNGEPSKPSLFNYSSGDPNAVTYYYSTTETNTGGTKWENIGPTTLSPGTYYMYAEIAETTNYKAYTTETSKFIVYKAYPTCVPPANVTATYGQKLSDITLTNPAGNTPGTWRWEKDTLSVGNASTTAKEFMAIFTPTDTVNYEVRKDFVEVTVKQAPGGSLGTVNLTQPYGDTAEYTFAPSWAGLPAGQTWNYGSSYALSAGAAASVTHSIDNATGKLTYAISGAKAGDVVTFTLKAQCNNYEDYTITLKITIQQATPTGEPGYTKITSRGKTLADVGLTVGTLSPAKGTLRWIDEEGNVLPGDTKVEANKSYTWLFIPTNENYAPRTGSITPWVSSGIVIVPSYPTESGNVSNPSTGAAGQGSIACGVAVLAAGICLLGAKKKNQE